MFNKLVNKAAEIMTAHPRLFSIAMGFAITLAVGAALKEYLHMIRTETKDYSSIIWEQETNC